jgi:protein O-mannosyl-transferase
VPRPALRGRGIFLIQPTHWLLLVLALAALVYVPGLNGPFLLDDPNNLLPVQDWIHGVAGWQEALFGNSSGLFSRPLSMLTFMLDAKLFGMAPFSFKLTNLLIHLACGALIYRLLGKLLRRDPYLGQRAALVALAISAIWLLHPLQVSTVLYVVQRMAQLSTLFILLALLAYLAGREALGQGRTRSGLAWLFLAVPAATVIGLLCKENGALAPLLCAVLELGYFRSSEQAPRPRAIKVFFMLGLILPVVAAGTWYAWPPSRLVAGYSGRTFTLGERLLSEPRVLFDYISAILLPRGPALGLYTDDFVASRGLLQPATTLLALCGLTGLIVIAFAARQRAPAVFTGIAFYLAGHVMESSVFPLELYFEHRNYLPSVGLFLALAGALKWFADRLPHAAPNTSRPRLWIFGAIALCTTLAAATAARAWVWQSWSTVVRQAVVQHPNSTRAQFENLSLVWNTGPADQTRQLLDQLSHSSNFLTRHVAAISTLLHECQTQHAIDQKSLALVAAIAGEKLQLPEMGEFAQLGLSVRGRDCAGLSQIELADMLRKIVDAAPQPQSDTALWRIRFTAAILYASGGNLYEAQRQAALAWDTHAADPAIGIELANLMIDNHDFAGARVTQAQLSTRIPFWDRQSHAAMVRIEQRLSH